MKLFWLVVSRCGWFSDGSGHLLVVLRFSCVKVGCFGWFDGGSRCLQVIVIFGGNGSTLFWLV